MTIARIDAWVWSVRLLPTRSQAAAACRAGHVRVNGHAVKPAQLVVPGDEVRVWSNNRERIVEVVQVINKRVGSPVAAQCLIDRTPAEARDPGPRLASRDRGTGRPTKRDRREIDRLRNQAYP